MLRCGQSAVLRHGRAVAPGHGGLVVLRHGLVLTTAGMLIGIGGALFLTRTLTRLLFQVSPFDGMSFLSSVVLLGLISIAAFLIPAVGAARLNPMRVLRGE